LLLFSERNSKNFYTDEMSRNALILDDGKRRTKVESVTQVFEKNLQLNSSNIIENRIASEEIEKSITKVVSENRLILPSKQLKKVKIKKTSQKTKLNGLNLVENKRNETDNKVTKNVDVTPTTLLKVFFTNVIQTIFVFLKTRKQ
jgi:hypothetical protein